MRVLVSDVLHRVEEAAARNADLKTGVFLLDKGSGIQFGALTIFYGPPGAAKTSLLSRIALDLTERDVQVVYVPYEEGLVQFARRVLPHLSDMAETNLILPEDGSISSLGDVAAFCDEELDSELPAVVILDSIQSFKVEEGTDNYAERFYGEVGALLRYAVKRRLALLFISEETTTKTGRHPKGTGGLRYKPNVLVHLSLKDGVLTVKIEKDRNGGRTGGLSRLAFNPAALRFTETDQLDSEGKARRPAKSRGKREAKLRLEADRLRQAMEANPGATKAKLMKITGLKRTRLDTLYRFLEVQDGGDAASPPRCSPTRRVRPVGLPRIPALEPHTSH